jgi:hypothetical protein
VPLKSLDKQQARAAITTGEPVFSFDIKKELAGDFRNAGSEY